MRKFVILLLSVFAFSCSQVQKPADDRPTITVSILPQKYMLEKIAGDAVNIMVLVPDGSGPETYEPTARQMQEISVSKACYITGLLDFEKSWIPKVSEIYPALKVVNLSEGLNLINGTENIDGDVHGETSDAHAGHNHAPGEGHAEDKHSIEGTGHESHNHGGIDPHIWLSIKEIRKQSETILISLQGLMPEKKDEFTKNYNDFIGHLDSVDKIITSKIAGVNGHISYMIYHPSLSYYSRDYGIEQIPIELEGKEPSPAYLKELIDIAKEKQITTIYYSQQFDKKSAETIAKQLGIGLSEFNPLESDIPANLLDFTDKLVSQPIK